MSVIFKTILYALNVVKIQIHATLTWKYLPISVSLHYLPVIFADSDNMRNTGEKSGQGRRWGFIILVGLLQIYNNK